MSDDEVHTGTSGASESYPQQCSALRKGGFVLIKDKPCKIVEMSTSKTGKHGHAKVHLVALDIFTGKKYEDICPSTHNMNVPHVKRTDFQLVDIVDGYLSLMDEQAETRDDIKVPEGDVGNQIMAAAKDERDVLVTVLKAMGHECAIAMKLSSK